MKVCCFGNWQLANGYAAGMGSNNCLADVTTNGVAKGGRICTDPYGTFRNQTRRSEVANLNGPQAEAH
jgi:hypothetical protein